VTVKVPASHHTAQGVPLQSARDRMDIISAYREVGTYQGAADLCGTIRWSGGHRRCRRGHIASLTIVERWAPPVRRASVTVRSVVSSA
jgi:hypothetical protein